MTSGRTPGRENGRRRKRPLSAEKERALLERWKEHGDEDALAILVERLEPRVRSIVLRYSSNQVSRDDLFAEGMLGLMQGIDRFDTTREVRLMTYASQWVVAYVVKAVLKGWARGKTRTGVSRSRIFFRLHRGRARAMALSGDPAKVAEHVAADLDVGVERVEEMLGQLETPDASLEAHAEALGVPTGELAIEAPDPPPDEILEQIQARDEMRRAVSSSLASLDDRERTVLHRKYLTDEPDTLAEIGRGLGISRERSRQIANEALGKLAAVMEESFPRASELVR